MIFSPFSFPSNALLESSSITIPKRTLSVGIYVAQLTISLDGVGLTNSDRVFFQIVQDNLKVFLEGGTSRKLPWSKDVKLDASESFDPNEEKSLQKKLTFLWYCKVDDGITVTGCLNNNHSVALHEGSMWLIPSRTLNFDVEYTFTVQVRNELQKRYSVKLQTIILEDAEIPIVRIK